MIVLFQFNSCAILTCISKNYVRLTILVIIICVEGDSALREFLIAATQEGMDSDEYVYISIEGRRGAGFRETCSSQSKKYA